MKYLKGITLAVMMLFVFAAIVPLVTAERDSLKVILLTEESTYKTGDNMTVEARVYDAGQLVDADMILVYLDTRWSGPDKEIEMAQVSTGIYQGSYEVDEDDHYLEFSCYAELGTDSDGSSLYAFIYEERLELDIHFSHQSTAYLWPGESVKATLTTKYRDEPVDVDEFTYLRLVDPEDTEIDLESERKAEGVYEVVLTMEEITQNMEYTLEANALYANAHANAQADIVVNVLTVWYKLETHAGSTATFSLGVADSKGKGVANAEINIEYPQDQKFTTDENGLALVSLTGVYNGATVRGFVESEDLIQSFQGQIYWEEEEEIEAPSHTGFDVVYDGNNYIYSAGSKVTRSYRAYNCSIPLSSGDIYYYITLEDSDLFFDFDGYTPNGWDYTQTSRVIKTGVVTTSILGEFSITYTAPQKQGLVYIWFESGIPKHEDNYSPHIWSEYDHDDDLVYEEDTDGMFITKGNMWDSSKISIETDPLMVGGKTKVTVKSSDALSDDDMLVAMWMVGSPEGIQSIFDSKGSWSCWVDGGEMIFLEETDDSKEFKGHSIIPDFMSDDDDFTIVAGTVEGDTGFPSANHATLKEGESAGEQNMEILVLILLGGAVLVILTILAFGAFTDNKNMNQEGSPPSQTPPSEGSSSPPSDLHSQGQPELAPETAKLSTVPMVNLQPPEGEVSPEEQVPKSANDREGADK